MVHPRPPPFTCTVHLEDLRSCFANLPNSIGQVILRRNAPLQNSVIELTWTDKRTERHAYVTWSGSPSGLKSGLNNGRYDKGDVIELDVAFAKANSISHGQLVTLKVMKDTKEAEYVNVEPADENDYEIVDSRQSFIESNLLKQLLVVYSGEIVPIRVNSNLVHISIGDLTPSSKYAKISSNTQVIVKPILRSSHTSTSSANGSHLPNSVRNYGLRILPQGFLSNDDGPYAIHVSTTDYPNLPLMHNNLAQISKVPQPQYNARQDHEEKNDGEAGTVGIGSLCVVVKGNAKVPTGHVYVTDVIRENIDLETFGILSSAMDIPPKLAGVSNLTKRLETYLKSCLAKVELKSVLAVPGLGGILLCGGHGSGKTAIAKTVAYSLALDYETLAHCVTVKCADATEDRISTVKEKLQQCFDEAAWRAPSIILFDDLDRLIPAEVEHMDSFRFRQLAECFYQIASRMTKRHRIAIFATVQQQTSVHSYLTVSHLFSEIVHLHPPTKMERKEIMETIMSSGPPMAKNSISKIDLLSVAGSTDGYLAADLKSLVERTIHEGVVRQINARYTGEGEPSLDDGELTEDDFKKAQDGFVPVSLRGVKLQTSSVNWSDIGGLKETRRILLETLEWPTKYASIFENCPLRLRSGLLLYGYPGCGKTLLASAVAKECGLNFISVKGPELLNKYIGASEKSVRDLFEKAQAAKPCVLFFDEFDSIAPKRGHDSTGVTDRVVNQMLTQMDGAEGLDGVYVLAATSRPDLIDPALLRPGRLDKSLFCNMPTLDERIEILNALARKMQLSSDVDFTFYAEKCNDYSGADLQALLYNAYLEAIRDVIDDSASTKQNTTKFPESKVTRFTSFAAGIEKNRPTLTAAEREQIGSRLALITKEYASQETSEIIDPKLPEKHMAIITNLHMKASLKITRPSITPSEYLRLSEMEFITGRNGEMPNGMATDEFGQRATLC